jgi:hypothetical protein
MFLDELLVWIAGGSEGVGKLRHRRLANLIGYCCNGDERLLVAELMPDFLHGQFG